MNAITTHVLDLAGGRPVPDLAVRLERRAGHGAWDLLAEAATDRDGRVRSWPGAPAAAPGLYRLTFATEAHLGAGAFYPEVAVVFRVEDAAGHHHVPLLLSPFGYTTYRGS